MSEKATKRMARIAFLGVSGAALVTPIAVASPFSTCALVCFLVSLGAILSASAVIVYAAKKSTKLGRDLEVE